MSPTRLAGVPVRLRWFVALGATALALGGCAVASSTTAGGGTLTIYASGVGAGASSADRDVIAAEQLAFQQAGSQIGKYRIRFITLNAGKLTDRARQAIQDKSTIAYIGELGPGISKDTVGITNDLDVLQVTPTDTALELTQSTPAVSGSPDRYYEAWGTYKHTLGRVVPSSSVEAKAQVEEMAALHVKSLFVGDDGSEYGRAIAQAVKGDAPAHGITITGTQAGADAVFYGGKSASAAARTFTSAAQGNPRVKLFGPSALGEESLSGSLSPAARSLYISGPGFMPKNLSATAKQQFAAPFQSAYGHAPAPQAIFGYEAVTALMDVLKQAGSSVNDRSTIVRNFLSFKRQSSVLGTYSINGSGDSTWPAGAPFIFSRLQAGKLVPFRFLQVQG